MPVTGYQMVKAKTPIGNIIVITDDEIITDRLAKWLMQNGYHFVFVDSEEEARTLPEYCHVEAVVRASEFLFPPGHLSWLSGK